jgi:hypothetical protein
MKTSLLALSAILALTCASGAMAYTTKTEAQMQSECVTKWKSDAGKVKACVNGKKGHQAKMMKSGNTTSSATMTKTKEPHVKKSDANVMDMKAMDKPVGQKAMENMKKM